MSEEAAQARSIWRKIWEFPLVAMIVALLCLALPIVLFTLSTNAIGGFGEHMPADAATALSAVIVVVLTALSYKLLVSRLGRYPRDELQFDAQAAPDTIKGIGIGAAVLGASFVVALALGGYEVLGLGDGDDTVELLFLAGLYAGVVEEIFFRGVIFRWLEELAGSWAALLLSALAFGFLHGTNPNATVFSSVAIAIEAGLLLGAVYMLTRSLWMPIGLHFGWNVMQGWVLDVPVSGIEMDGLLESRATGNALISGGSFGLEASVVCLALAALAGVWLLRKAIQAGELKPPMWRKKPA